jgi:hypothetical protein
MSSLRRFEPWAYAAFLLMAAVLGLFFYLGMRPGGRTAVWAYRFGLLGVGWASAVGMLAALLYCARRRPLLQRGRAWPLTALGAALWMCSLPIAYPSSHEGRFSSTRFRLPFTGTARVLHGGERATENPLRFDPARCFGFTFAPLGTEALKVVAPAAATLERIIPGSGAALVVLSTGRNEYCLLEGLERLSPDLRAGCSLVPGSALGESAHRLTVHLQDSVEPGMGEGIPLRFWDYRANGRLAEVGVPVPPQEVSEPTSPPAPESAH